MATRSNFKRAVPQAKASVLAPLRTTQMVDESKAILPAGMYS
jgi:recyclin-1